MRKVILQSDSVILYGGQRYKKGSVIPFTEADYLQHKNFFDLEPIGDPEPEAEDPAPEPAEEADDEEADDPEPAKHPSQDTELQEAKTILEDKDYHGALVFVNARHDGETIRKKEELFAWVQDWVEKR